MATPGKPRTSGIPTPGKPSGVPTPGRSRSTSSATQPGGATHDFEYMSRAFADAIKANDPAQHRTSRVSDTSGASLSPQSLSFTSGRRSVTGRPSSVASSSSAASSGLPQPFSERAKTPTTVRPPSRHSDVFGRSVSRAGRAFDVGDNVRIESLGYEGMLRYIGEIEGKPGLWAGVELSGGFSGKGKNNGTVNGKQYFSCPPNCGVFVAMTKLSPPTVGLGAVHRPSSVASSRGGRVTPSVSGRVTPSASALVPIGRVTPSASISNGRVTPSAGGRITPSLSSGRITPGTTPAARTRLQTLSKSTSASNANNLSLTDKITVGSRASKYVSMTAKQLTSRDAGATSPSPRRAEIVNPSRLMGSPTTTSRTLPSPTRPPGSPFSTPKPTLVGRISAPGIGGSSTTPIMGRPSLSTPRPRIPSAIAMPPPASPSSASSSRSISLNDQSLDREILGGGSFADLESYGNGFHEKSIHSTSGKVSTTGQASSRPESATSMQSTTTDDRALIDRLQSRVDALEYENERLRHASITSKVDTQQLDHVENLQVEQDQAMSRIVQLQESLEAAECLLKERDSKIQTLEQSCQQAQADMETRNNDSEERLKALELKLEESAVISKSLKDTVDLKEGVERQTEASLKAKDAEVVSLRTQLERVYAELEEERRELGAQVDELRQAGQETIALYEERLSTADGQRYDLENRIALLEAGDRPPAPLKSSSQVTSATQIDNETLRDQVHHLQKKLAALEDTLEDVHATSEKEETALRERMKRLKDKEEAMKKELNEGRKEVDRMSKSEASARGRVEEIEEALRESTVALENARAEVEGLRAELNNLDGLVADGTATDLPSRVASVAQRASTDRTRFNEEIAKLKESLEEYRDKERKIAEQLALNQEPLMKLETQNAQLEQHNEAQATKLIKLHQILDERTAELDSLKKKLNRELPVNNGVQESLKPSPQSPSSKYDLAAAREEITGLKHIVQELQKENLAAIQQNKLLESENQLLSSEATQLRQEVKILEDNLDQNLIREELALDDVSTSSGSADVEYLQRALKEQKSKSEMELEQLRKRLTDAEMKNARTTHDLNKEISELEALVESKIYREDELEQELERLKEKLTRQKKSSKNRGDSVEARHQSSGTLDGPISNPSHLDVCEICERPGHDIFNCDLLKEDVPASKRQASNNLSSSSSLDLFCDDCESHGHVAADCPHSLDVF